MNKQISNEVFMETKKKSLSKDFNKINTVNFIDDKERELKV